MSDKCEYNFSDFFNMTNDGAYMLGLISSIGTIENNIITITQDENILPCLLEALSKRIVGNNSLVSSVGVDTFSLNSKELVDFITPLYTVLNGAYNHKVGLFDMSDDIIMSFICGYFEGSGKFSSEYTKPEISMNSDFTEILSKVASFWDVVYYGGKTIDVSGYKALDICGRMYKNVSFKYSKKYEYFMYVLNWAPGTCDEDCNNQSFKYKKLSEDAIAPYKDRVTDSGYDIFAVEINYKKETDLYVADTKIAVEPIPGWYFDMVGRSSLPKSGYMFVGAVGVIDKSYTGPVKMLLKKIRKDAPIPKVPFKMGQLIPRRIMHADFVEVTELSDTDRGSGGFGSTN